MIKVIGIAIALFCCCANARDLTLSADEGYIVINVEDIGIPRIESVIFKHADSKSKIRIDCRDPFVDVRAFKNLPKRCSAIRPKKVKAGYYYLSSITPITHKLRPLVLKPPNDDELIEIKSNSVTYLGDWEFAENRQEGTWWNFELDYSLELLEWYRDNYPFLRDYPTYVTGLSGKSVSVKWPK